VDDAVAEVVATVDVVRVAAEFHVVADIMQA
jgi:hypothetical protein